MILRPLSVMLMVRSAPLELVVETIAGPGPPFSRPARRYGSPRVSRCIGNSVLTTGAQEPRASVAPLRHVTGRPAIPRNYADTDAAKHRTSGSSRGLHVALSAEGTRSIGARGRRSTRASCFERATMYQRFGPKGPGRRAKRYTVRAPPRIGTIVHAWRHAPKSDAEGGIPRIRPDHPPIGNFLSACGRAIRVRFLRVSPLSSYSRCAHLSFQSSESLSDGRPRFHLLAC